MHDLFLQTRILKIVSELVVTASVNYVILIARTGTRRLKINHKKLKLNHKKLKLSKQRLKEDLLVEDRGQLFYF